MSLSNPAVQHECNYDWHCAICGRDYEPDYEQGLPKGMVAICIDCIPKGSAYAPADFRGGCSNYEGDVGAHKWQRFDKGDEWYCEDCRAKRTGETQPPVQGCPDPPPPFYSSFEEMRTTQLIYHIQE